MKKMEALHVVAIVPKRLNKAVGLVQLVINVYKTYFNTYFKEKLKVVLDFFFQINSWLCMGKLVDMVNL